MTGAVLPKVKVILLSITLTAGAPSVSEPAWAQRPAEGATLLYVDDDAPPGGNGLTWPNAIRRLQDALVVARGLPPPVEIRLAQGVYRPDQGTDIVAGDIAASFHLVDRSLLLGGFAGMGAPDPNERNAATYVSMLNGDLLSNDGPNFTNYGDNSIHVVRATNVHLSTLLDGLTVMASQGDFDTPGPAGGLKCFSGGLTLNHCRFERNLGYSGAGFASENADIIMTGCVFAHNRASYGGGAFLEGVFPGVSTTILIEDCVFVSNDCDAGLNEPGALRLGRVRGTVRRTLFELNRANGSAGGAIEGAADVVVEDCVFRNNYAYFGGAAWGSGTYLRCMFQHNSAGDRGGAYWMEVPLVSRHATFIDCEFAGNTTNATRGGAASGGRNFIGCDFLDNRAGLTAGPFGPGGAIVAHIPIFVQNCTFDRNRSSGAGGAIHIPVGSAANIMNSTFIANDSTSAGEAVDGSATICNSVFGPHAGTLLSGVTSVDYSCLPMAWTGPGTGNIVAADPGFVNPLGPDGIPGTEDDDLRLRPDSPCIDAGNSNALPADAFDLDDDGDIGEPLPLDAFGNARILETPHVANTGVPPSTGGTAVIDMGAHEYRRPADIHPDIGDGFVDINDLLDVINAWGPCSPPTPPDPDEPCHADIDDDGEVGGWDLLEVIFNWG